MGSDFPNRAAMNWGSFQDPVLQQASANAVNAVDPKQKTLVKAIASIVQAAAVDLYGSNKDAKYRYIVDLILDRIRDALAKQLASLGEEQLEAVSKQNKELLKTMSESTAGIVQQAFEKLDVNVNEKQANSIVEQLQSKLDEVAKTLASQVKAGAAKKRSSAEDDAVTKSDQLETTKAIEDLKKQLAKQFSADKSSNVGSSTSYKKSGRSAFKAASALVISKQLSALAKNQKIINQSMTKRFEKTTKTISGKVGKMHQATSTNFYNLNDKLEDSMAKIGRQTKRISAGVVGAVVGSVALVTGGLKKTFGAIFGGLKSISSGLFKLFKKPASVIGDLLKNIFTTPGGMFAIGWIAGYVWQRWLKRLWDWMKPIRETIWEWFGGKISFKDMCGKIWDHISGGFKSIIDGVTNWFTKNWGSITKTASDIWEWIQGFGKKVWGWLEPKLQKAWNFLKPIIMEGLKKVWDWFLDFKFCSVLGVDITGKRIMILLATYLLTNMALKCYKLVKGLGSMIKGLSKGIGVISKGVKGFGKGMASLGGKIKNFLGFGNKAKDAAKLAAEAKKAAELAQKASKAKNAAEAMKQSKKAADAAKKARDLAAATKKTKDAVKIAKEAQQATLAAGRATRAVNIATKAATNAASTTGKVAAATAGKTALKTVGKVAGRALVALDVGMDAWDAINAAKVGEYGKAASKIGFAAAKAATLAAGPFAPVAYGAIMGAEAIKGKIDDSAKAFDEAINDMNARAAAGMDKLKEIYAQKKIEDANKSGIDKLLEKYKKHDQTKAEFDPLLKQRNEISKRLKEAQESTFSFMKGDTIKKLLEEEDKLNQQISELTAKSGLSEWELEHDKNQIADSRNSQALLKRLSPEMKERFKQLMAENTKIGPDNLKFLPDTQKILEQMQVEFGGQTEKVESKVDGVADATKQIIGLLQDQKQLIEKQQGQNWSNLPPIMINQQQYQTVPERPLCWKENE